MPKLNLGIVYEDSNKYEDIIVEVKIWLHRNKHNHNEEKCSKLRGLLGAQGNCLLK
jgi:hypothetical protein